MDRKWGSRIVIVTSAGLLIAIVADLLRDRDIHNPTSASVQESELHPPPRGGVQEGASAFRPNLSESWQARHSVTRRGSLALPAVPSGVLEPLSAEVFRRRVIEIFPNAYLSLMAIIQGAAFGLLFISVQPALARETEFVQYATTLSQVFGVGLTIIIVTHQYLMLTAIACWVPTVFDTCIPYFLGFGEIWMALAAGRNVSWWMALSSLSLVAAYAFWYTRTRTVQGVFVAKQEIYLKHRRSITVQIFLCIVMFVTSVSAAVLNSVQACPALVNIGLVLGVILVGLAILLQGEHDQNRAYEAYDIPRFRFRNPRSRY